MHPSAQDAQTQCYLGAAQVQLKHLYYLNSIEKPDDCQGCCVSDIDHNIPVIIETKDYRDAISRSGVQDASLYRIGLPPKLFLSPTLRLPCLHGKFRLEAAQRDSPSDDQWWCVDLYSSKSTLPTQLYVREQYSKHPKLCDGEIFLHVRFFQRENQEEEAEKYLRKLSEPKRKNLRRISGNAALSKALEDLEVYRSLWANFHLGPFAPLLSWHCNEELVAYLRGMLQTLRRIFGSDYFWCDPITLRCLQGLAPARSQHEQSHVKELLDTKNIFCRVNSESQRSQLLTKVLSQSRLILSFATFSTHVYYIQPVMINFRELFFPGRVTGSMQAKLKKSCSSMMSKPEFIVQYGDNDERFVNMAMSARFRCAYWQACLCAIRIDTYAPTPRLRREWAHLNETPGSLIRLAQFMDRIGFESDRIQDLKQLDPSEYDIRNNMYRERPPNLFFVEVTDFDKEALERRSRQGIFTARSDSLLEDDYVAKLYFPAIADLITGREVTRFLTPFARAALVLSEFFEWFYDDTPGTPSETTLTAMLCPASIVPSEASPECSWPDSETVSPIHGQAPGTAEERPMDNDWQQVHPDIRTHVSENPGELVRATSSIYSRSSGSPPRYPPPRVRIIRFYKLTAQLDIPTETHSCHSTASDLKRTMDNIEAKNEEDNKVMWMLYGKGHLHTVSGNIIPSFCVGGGLLNSVYYANDVCSWKEWINRSLDRKRPTSSELIHARKKIKSHYT